MRKRIKDESGKVIAEVWRYEKPRKGKVFGLSVEGILWKPDGKPTTRSGFSCTSFPRQRDAIAAIPAARALLGSSEQEISHD